MSFLYQPRNRYLRKSEKPFLEKHYSDKQYCVQDARDEMIYRF